MTTSDPGRGNGDRPARVRRVKIGDREVLTHGVERRLWGDLYHYCMIAPWWAFFLGFAATFLSINTLFAFFYWLGDAPVANAKPGFEDLFYFSIETLATVGYGDMHPQTRYGHMVATFEIFTGMSIIAVMTGIVFSRFARPRARVIFANAPIIGSYDGQPTLMLRMANHRYNMIAGATAKLWVTRVEETREGRPMRRVRELKLERAENPMFALSWTIFHVLDAASPLSGLDAEALARSEASLVVTFNGIDESSGQSLNARRGYTHDDLRWGHQYVDILNVSDDGRTHIDYTKFHDSRPEAS